MHLLPNLPSEGPYVLLVDDRRSGLIPLQRLLEAQNIPILTALSTAGAIEVLEANEISVVVADWILPGGPDGLTLLDEVARRWPKTERLLISGSFDSDLVVTAYGSNHRAVSKSAVDVIVHHVVAKHREALAEAATP